MEQCDPFHSYSRTTYALLLLTKEALPVTMCIYTFTMRESNG
jgi:hypothetical protein